MESSIEIVVIDHGFVYVGRCEYQAHSVTIHGARCLIRWGTTEHLGQLRNGPRDETKLGASCTVEVKQARINHVIEVDQDAWKEHID